MDIKKKIEAAYINMHKKSKSKNIPIIYDGKTELMIDKTPIIYDGKTETSINLKTKNPLKESLDHADDDIAIQNIMKHHVESHKGLDYLRYNSMTPKFNYIDDNVASNNFGNFHKHASELFDKKFKEEYEESSSKEHLDKVKKHYDDIKSTIDNHLKTNFYNTPELSKKINEKLINADDDINSYNYSKVLYRQFDYAKNHKLFGFGYHNPSNFHINDLTESPKTLKELKSFYDKYKLKPTGRFSYTDENNEEIVIHKGKPKKIDGYLSAVQGYDAFFNKKREVEREEFDSSHKMLSEHINEYPSTDSHKSILDYTGSLSGPLNRHILRKHVPKEHFEIHESDDYENGHIDDPIEKENKKKVMSNHFDNHSNLISEGLQRDHHFPNDFHIYSGLGSKIDVAKIIEDNGNKQTAMRFPAFTSTSIRYMTAISFAKYKDPHKEGYLPYKSQVQDVLKIRVPKDHTRGRYLEHDSTKNSGEFEYLLDKDHIVHVHPEPKLIHDYDSITRVWDAHIHKNGNEND